MATVHDVKSWTFLFQAIQSGAKTHDIRDVRDRNYAVGDLLVLNEFDQATGKYTGAKCVKKITYMTDRSTPCAFSSSVLDRNFAILSLGEP